MASSYDVNEIKVCYKRIEPVSEGDFSVYIGNPTLTDENIISATIVNGIPTLDEYFNNEYDENHDYYVYQGKYIIGGTTYDMWKADQEGGCAYYYTNVIVNNSGTEFLDPSAIILPLVSIYNPDIITTLTRNADGWVELPQPSEYVGSSSTIVSSARNAKGVIISDVVREDVSKVELTWNFLTLEQFAAIAQLFSSTYAGETYGKFFVKVRYFDSVANDWLVKIMYPNDRAFEVAQITLDRLTGKPIGYKGFSLHLIDTCKEV